MYRIKCECRYKSYAWLLICFWLWLAVTVDFSYCRCSLWGLLLRASKWFLLVLISSTIALQTGYYLAFWIYVGFLFACLVWSTAAVNWVLRSWYFYFQRRKWVLSSNWLLCWFEPLRGESNSFICLHFKLTTCFTSILFWLK